MPQLRANHLRRRDGESGQVIVEFVLVLPWLLALLFLVIDFAILLNHSSDLNHVAAETARRAAVNQDETFDPVAYAKDATAPGLSDDVTVNVCLAEGKDPGGVVEIALSADRGLMEIVPGLPEVVSVSISGQAAMRLEAPATFDEAGTCS